MAKEQATRAKKRESRRKGAENYLLADYMTEKEWAEQRDVTKRTLQRERQQRTGAPFTKVGRNTYYRIDAARAWLLAREQTPVRGESV